MSEKETALLSDDYGRDLASVQALQRKHEGLERDLDGVSTLRGEGMQLSIMGIDGEILIVTENSANLPKSTRQPRKPHADHS